MAVGAAEFGELFSRCEPQQSAHTASLKTQTRAVFGLPLSAVVAAASAAALPGPHPPLQAPPPYLALTPPCRHQMEQAIAMTQVSQVTAILTWGASGLRLAMHSLRAEALLATSCCLVYTALLAASCWRRGAYLRHARYLTAAALVQSHGAAAYISATGYSMMAGRCVWGACMGRVCWGLVWGGLRGVVGACV
jgi:hypothetical protein